MNFNTRHLCRMLELSQLRERHRRITLMSAFIAK